MPTKKKGGETKQKYSQKVKGGGGWGAGRRRINYTGNKKIKK